ncbi:MAG: MoaD/ThiS family protein [Sporomusaceae bacterium]|nr:MoaD/ThiS family protein [Sporomusaceae bacterium]
MVRIKFFPPIAHRANKIEHSITLDGGMDIDDFIRMLRSRPDLASYFERIDNYGRGDNFLRSVIVMVNDRLADVTIRVNDGDVVKFILPLAGG